MPVNPNAPAIEANAAVTGVMVGTPMYGGVCFDAFNAGVWDLQHECQKIGITVAMATIRNESLIHRARNRILADFMASPCSHLIMIDADIGFEARDVLRLVAHNRPFIGGVYAKKDRARYNPAFVPLPGPMFQREDDGLVEVMCLPGGFMMLKRETVAQLLGAHADDWYWDGSDGTQKRRMHDLTACILDKETRTLWSEDYSLCLRWRALGGQIWMDPYIQLTHNGTTTFDGDPMSIFSEVPAPVAVHAIDAPAFAVVPA